MPDLDVVPDLPAKALRPQIARVGLRVDSQGIEPVRGVLRDGQHPLRPVQGVGVVLQDQVGAGVCAGELVFAFRGGVLHFLHRAADPGGLDVVRDGGVI
jgi:hypothetical protein